MHEKFNLKKHIDDCLDQYEFKQCPQHKELLPKLKKILMRDYLIIAQHEKISEIELFPKNRKKEGMFMMQKSQYHLVQLNKKIFDRKYAGLVGSLYAKSASNVRCVYKKIDGLINFPTPMGREVDAFLALFDDDSI